MALHMNSSQLFATATNLAYPLAALPALWGDGPLATVFFLACFGLGLGSGLFHWVEKDIWTIRRWGRRADEVGMYMVFSTLVWLALGVTTWIPVVIGWCVLGALVTELDSHVAVPALAASAFVKIIAAGAYGWAAGIAALFALAYGAHRMGGASSWTHGLWHLLSAAGIAGLYASITTLL